MSTETKKAADCVPLKSKWKSRATKADITYEVVEVVGDSIGMRIIENGEMDKEKKKMAFYHFSTEQDWNETYVKVD